MTKIKKPPPSGILDHLVKRYRQGRISAGNGEMPSTFLAPGTAVEGDEVQ